MSEFKFDLDPAFQAMMGQHQQAIEEAQKREKNVMGIQMPVGTKGSCTLVGFETGQNKPKDGQPGAHYIQVCLMISTPEQYANSVETRRFTLNPTERSTVADRWAQFYDYLEECGLPHEVRTANGLQGIAAWFQNNPQTFGYEVTDYEGNDGRTYKQMEINNNVDASGLPQPADVLNQGTTAPPTVSTTVEQQVPASAPTEVATVTEQPVAETFTVEGLQFTKGQKVTVNGRAATVNGPSPDNKTVHILFDGDTGLSAAPAGLVSAVIN